MKDIANYLMKNYYTRCPEHLIPTEENLVKALDLHKDKLIVVHEGGEMRGVGLFLTLSDETMYSLELFDITNVDDLAFLLNDSGPHLHFILVASNGVKCILQGIKQAKNLKPKSVSWWNPQMTKLHKYNLN